MNENKILPLEEILHNLELENARIRLSLSQGYGGNTEMQTLKRIFYGVDDHKQTSNKTPMTSTEATEKYRCDTCKEHGDGACGFDCVLSRTCSFLCSACRRVNFFEGDLKDAPSQFFCRHCRSPIVNKHIR